jgi:hypothetical protein
VRSTVLTASEDLCREVASFDPAVYSGEDCAVLAEVLSRAEKACAGARARAAARAVACGAHKSRGFADGAGWLARSSGTTLAEARDQLWAGNALGSLPATLQAVAAGDLSLAQAAEVARAEAASPGCEAGLVEVARRAGLATLKEEARLALAAPGPEELFARQHRARSFRHWTDAGGMWRFAGALPPTTGVALANRIGAEAARIRRAAGPGGRAEPFEAHAADALVSLLSSSGQGRPPKAEVVIVCELPALRRGHALPGEACEVIGGGPVPVSWVREALDHGAFVKGVLHDGVKIGTVAHFGRHLPAELRTALALGSPPGFEGAVCSQPGCGRRYGLQVDHITPVAANGPTSYENLQHLCYLHHAQKTERDRQAGLLGPGPPSTSGGW